MTADKFQEISVQNPQFGSVRVADIPDNIDVRPVEMVSEDGAVSRGLLHKKRGVQPRIGVHMMHPRADQSLHYNVLPIAMAGYAVLARGSRWPNNDSATVHEYLLPDFAAGIALLAAEGCEQVVAVGSSGGSSLAAFYQAQACASPGTRLTRTPAGDALDLNQFRMPPLDGIAIIGGHVGQGLVLGKAIDPSVVDEMDPLALDPLLDLYDPRNGFVTPPAPSCFDQAFLERYREAQLARVRRIDARARLAISLQREAAEAVRLHGPKASIAHIRAAQFEPHMVVYRTAANPEFVDPSIEPDGRRIESYFTDRPDLENYGRDGFARCITPRAWLSTWSALSSNARTIDNLERQAAPLLIVHYSGDCGTRLSEVQAMYDKSPSLDKTLEIVRGINHYGLRIMPDGSKGPRAKEGTEHVVRWLQARFPSGA